MKKVLFLLLTFYSALSSQAAETAFVQMLRLGSKVPDFNLPGVDGRNYTLKDFAAAKILAIVFTCNHCPTAQYYEDRIQKLASEYKDKGVALVAISPNDPKSVRLDELEWTGSIDALAVKRVIVKAMNEKKPW